MATYTARLMQDSGVSGPKTTFDAEDLTCAAHNARAWALGQTGWPWDMLTITDEDTSNGYELQAQGETHMATNLYRVRVKSTSSLQPGDTFWNSEVLYCGYDRDEALQVYHESEPSDFNRSYGNSVRKTLFELLNTEELEEHETGEMQQVEID